MKNLYRTNKWLIIINLLLYLTIYFGMIFQIFLGAVQVLMSIYIFTKYNSLDKRIKPLFIAYVVLTVIILSLITSGLIVNTGFITVYLIIPMLLAFFHLYITYKIRSIS
jgi:hypothetical protein